MNVVLIDGPHFVAFRTFEVSLAPEVDAAAPVTPAVIAAQAMNATPSAAMTWRLIWTPEGGEFGEPYRRARETYLGNYYATSFSGKE